ncbi:hypothetical protein F5Y09DRAFT_356792 [Xylaria sp. FL1042]|nr:hypothetical protein F5Y09DRAFT_356792 [Xylaria sp. FL1042]
MSADSNTADQYPVYVGIWNNWSRGQILGGTLTLGRREANLLIAFTAFFIAFVATRVWRIICFAIHRPCSKKSSQNAIYHQHQAILRNSSAPEDGILLLTHVLRAGKGSTGRFRPLSTAVVATVCIVSFAIASGFSSSISTAIGDEVLIKSINCGSMPAKLLPTEIPLTFAYHAQKNNAAANYAQQCYSGGGEGLLDCGRFVTKQIVGNVNINATCPFGNGICRNNSSNIRIDSGYLSSHDHFGLNAPPDHRILWRNVYHCAPLITKDYTSQINASFGEATIYRYGSSTSSTKYGDYIYAAKSLDAQYSFVQSNSSVVSYSNFDIHTSGFLPINSVIREDADIDIHFLSGNGVTFIGPSNDSWYRQAAVPENSEIIGTATQATDSIKVYLPSDPSSPLGCTDQYQFCNAVSENRTCGPLASLHDALAGASGLFNTTHDDVVLAVNATTRKEALLTYFAQAISESSIYSIVKYLGPASLRSQKYLLGGYQYYLEADQWQHDVAHWWDISMAAHQASFLSYAYGPTDPALLAERTNFTTPELKKLCNSQKIRTTAYGSFSLFGLVFIFSVGGALVITSYLLEPVSTYLYKKKGYKMYEHLEWASNATLQLQRLAHEEAGFGTWSNCTGTAPSTKADELLGALDITNADHPILKPPTTEKTDNLQTSIEAPSAVQHSTQTEDTASQELAPSPTITCSSLRLQPTQSTNSHKINVELLQAHVPAFNPEVPETTTELQDTRLGRGGAYGVRVTTETMT